jgi:hypothetical protein
MSDEKKVETATPNKDTHSKEAPKQESADQKKA